MAEGNFFQDALRAPFDLLGLNAHHIPLAGPILFDNPAEEAHRRMLERAAQAYEAYRQPAYQAKMDALRQSLQALGPSNQMLQQMYGTAPSLEFQDPFGGAPPPVPAGPQPEPRAGGEQGLDIAGSALFPLTYGTAALPKLAGGIF